MKIKILFLILVGSIDLSLAQQCNELIDDVRSNTIFRDGTINSVLMIKRDSILYSLDPILDYKSIPEDSTDLRLFDAAAYLVAFEHLISQLEAEKRNYFNVRLENVKNYLCESTRSQKPDAELVKQTVKEKLDTIMQVYAALNRLAIDSHSVLRGPEIIRVKFVSSPAGASIQYISNLARIQYGGSIPDELWLDADDG